MPNNLILNGAKPQKETRWTPLQTGRWSSGIWTNRSPLRDANTTRLVEKFYGPSGDALIAGLNTEITNKLTLARRPGTSRYDNNTYTGVKRFYSFRLFNDTTEQIDVMVDQSDALYSTHSGTKSLVFTKSAGSGQSYMQSVGNTLYFTDGVDNKKWLQTLFGWSANTQVGTGNIPFFSTFLVDNNGFIQQLWGTAFPVTSVTINPPTPTTDPTLTVTSSIVLSTLLAVGDVVTDLPLPVAIGAVGNAISYTILSITGTSMVVSYPFPILYSGTIVTTVTAFAVNGGEPTTGGSNPSFSTTVPAISNRFQGGKTIDGSAVWVNRGLTVENWGINNLKSVPIVPIIGDTAHNITLGFSGQIPLYQTNTAYALNSYVTDINGNIQQATVGGTSGLAAPLFNQILGETTFDGSVTWTLVYKGALSTFNGGYKYTVALVNTLDNTVSNGAPLSDPTGNFIGGQGIYLAPGMGLPPIVRSPGALFPASGIDPQSDYVAIFRTTDGQSVPFLIPGESTTYTLPLSEYLSNGYTDTTSDTGLNNLISAPIALENSVPQLGAKNLTYHLDRIFYSVGNVVYWTTGPSTPVGNGVNGYTPGITFSAVSSLVTKLVPTPVGLFVFTISDVYVIQGNGTISNPITPAVPIIPGLGLPSYNALAMNGSIIGMFTTDSQFVTIDPSDAVSYVGFPIGDQLATNNGLPGTVWVPSLVYVTWHVEGEDQAWYVSDGQFGWYRLMTTPAPEVGLTWSPYARINNGGIRAVQSIETSPGVHQLLIAPAPATTTILFRDVNVSTDNLMTYAANATIGSCVLAQPGQVAAVSFITTESVKIGSPLFIGVLVDEALPYYTGPIDYIKRWEYDPPGLKESQSLYNQRFYLSDLPDEAAIMRHCQIQITWSPTDTVQNELLSLTIFGAIYQEI